MNILERYLIKHCSPTLASLKTANLFNLSYSSYEEIEEYLCDYKNYLAQKDISITVLKKGQDHALIYVYRKKSLHEDLNKTEVFEFLHNIGYQYDNYEEALDYLIERMSKSEDFPHEIGLFLGYPLEDVLGFIYNKGKNYKCIGCWKVYCNECDALKQFEKFKKCKDVYWKHWNQGKSVMQLTVMV